MQLAYNEAILAWEQDEVPIGALAVHENKVIGAAHNQTQSRQDPTAHAEMLALTQAANYLKSWRLIGVTLYVTKEPCPMCSGALIMSRIPRAVYAFTDPQMGCLGGAIDLHQLPRLNHRVQTFSGVFEEECKNLLQSFFQMKRIEDSINN